ncbi:16151_t:CDS:2, partial [Dentiscutata heterogama]
TFAEMINILRQWPLDEDLLCAVYEGYQQAYNFAKVLSMANQNEEVFGFLNISNSRNTIADFNTIEIHDDNFENDLRDARFELTFSLSDTNFSNNHDLETCENFYIGITEAGTLDISYLVNLRKNHKCYTNSGHMVFSHISAKFFIYFLGFGDFIHVDEQHNLITLFGKALELYRFFNEFSTKNLL